MQLRKRGAVWNIQFRHAKKFYNRSTGCENHADAQIRAAQIVLEVARATATPESLQAEPTAEPKTDAGLDYVIQLYFDWLKSSFAHGEKSRPRLRTAKDYACRLRLLAEKLHVATVRELQATVNVPQTPLTAARLGMSEARFVPLVRSAAGIFGLRALRYFESRELKIQNPLLGYIPQVMPQRPFVPPSKETVAALVAAAHGELRDQHHREYLLFMLCLGAGLRVQEAAFVRWNDVMDNCIRAATTSDHKNKSNRTRDIPVGKPLLDVLNQSRGVGLAYVVPDGASATKPARNAVPEGRCYRAARRLAKWLPPNTRPDPPQYEATHHFRPAPRCGPLVEILGGRRGCCFVRRRPRRHKGKQLPHRARRCIGECPVLLRFGKPRRIPRELRRKHRILPRARATVRSLPVAAQRSGATQRLSPRRDSALDRFRSEG